MTETRPAARLPVPARTRLAAFASRLGVLLVRLAGDALLVDVAWETWRGGLPARAAVAAAVAVFLALTVWVLTQGGRIGGRGWLTDPAAPYVLFLALLVWVTGSRADIAGGMRALGRPADVVLTASLLALVLAGAARVCGPGGVRTPWLRLGAAALAAYAAWSLALALAGGTGLLAVLGGQCEWRALPSWLRGGAVGAFGVLPLAWFHEFADSMTRLTVAGLLRWMIIFALGVWIAARVAMI
jgi:hypothetical protein